MKLQSLHLRRGDEIRRAVFAVVSENELASYAAAPDLLLGASELAQFERLKFAPKRHSFLLGRLAAKTALGAVLEEAHFPAIEICAGVFGQPLITHARAPGIDVTLSHSHGLAVALAFPAAWPIGLDLETVAPDVVATLLAEMNLSASESSWYAAATAATPVDWAISINPASACGVLWGVREALGKAMKTGVHSPLGVLSASAIEPAPKTLGINAWHGGYTNFAQFHWYAQIVGERVLTLTLPREVELEQGLRL